MNARLRAGLCKFRVGLYVSVKPRFIVHKFRAGPSSHFTGGGFRVERVRVKQECSLAKHLPGQGGRAHIIDGGLGLKVLGLNENVQKG